MTRQTKLGRRPLLIVDCPTPQRAPTLNALADKVDFVVAYIDRSDTLRGWGPVAVEHPHVMLSRGSARSLLQILKLSVDHRTSAVCTFGYWRLTNLAAISAARVMRKPLVVRSDSNEWRDSRRPRAFRIGKRFFLRLVLGRRLRVWTVGRRNAEYWSALGYHDQVAIPYTVPRVPRASEEEALQLREELTIHPKQFVILCVGRLEAGKGILDLCQAFRPIALHFPEAHLVIVGDGPERRAVERLAEDVRAVTYVGAVPQPELGSFYAMADLVVVPSHAEGWGLVVNEALVNGCRVVASLAVGAADDLVTAENGSRFPPHDVDALRSVLAEEVRRGPSRTEPLIQPDVVPLFEQELRRLSC